MLHSRRPSCDTCDRFVLDLPGSPDLAFRNIVSKAPCTLRCTYCKVKKARIDVEQTVNSVGHILDRFRSHQEFNNRPAHGSLNG
jgi:hypothetical protein